MACSSLVLMRLSCWTAEMQSSSLALLPTRIHMIWLHDVFGKMVGSDPKRSWMRRGLGQRKFRVSYSAHAAVALAPCDGW